jgi:hypothetical protein
MTRHNTTPSALLNDLAQTRRERNRWRDAATRRAAERRKAAQVRIIDRAFLDALALITVGIGGGHVGREYSPLPARRWRYAAALLRMARLTTGGRDLRLQLPPDPADALAMLEEATCAARVMPGRFAREVPPSLRPALLQPLHRQ